METVESSPKAVTASELKAQLDAERVGVAFLVLRDAGGVQQILPLGAEPRWVGRRPSVDVSLAWDSQVSGVHAQLEPGGGEWTLVDDGLSRNGSWVNGVRVQGRRRLRDRDLLRFGRTVLLYRAPGGETPQETALAVDAPAAVRLSETQEKVLRALCRPFKDEAAHATPATNQQIADELFLSVQAVKAHLRALFEKLGVEDLPQNAKRSALVGRALQNGLVQRRDL